MTHAAQSPALPAGRRERKKQTTRDAIFKVARELFNKKGFANTSVEEITERVDIAQSTFFNYFARKEDLLTEIFRRNIPALNKKCREIVRSQSTFKKKIHHIFDARLKNIRGNEHIVRAMIVNSVAVPLDRTYREAFFEEFKKSLSGLLEKAQRDKVIRPDVPADKMADVLEGVFTIFVIDWIIKRQNGLKPSELYDRLTICLEGMLRH